MITAVDTSVLLDVFAAGSEHGRSSRDALESCMAEGSLVISDVALAEIVAAFPDERIAIATLVEARVVFTACTRDAATAAGVAWRRYRAAGGPRTRLIAEFLIGAHAVHQADRLISRDRGFYRRHYADLRVLDPSAIG